MTLYRHFPSKEALFEGLVTAMCEYMREGLENAPSPFDEPAAKGLADELRAFTSALIEPDALALYRLIVADGWRFPDLSRVFDQSGMRIIGMHRGNPAGMPGIPRLEHRQRFRPTYLADDDPIRTQTQRRAYQARHVDRLGRVQKGAA